MADRGGVGRLHLTWHGYRYFPYEIELARREVAAVLGSPPSDTGRGLAVDLDGHAPERARRLTYVRAAELPGGRLLLTDQARLEGAEAVGAGSRTPAARQRTRYSAHGLHEYRGKFNPQVVRAVGNVIGLEPGDWLLDPFCGSGTTLLESAHSAWNCWGVDRSPLAVLISNAKLQALRTPAADLRRAADEVARELSRRTRGLDFEAAWGPDGEARAAGAGWMDALPSPAYLARWFPSSVLAQFAAVLRVTAGRGPLTGVLRALLSDLARRASYQEPGDLRARRRSRPAPNYPVVPWYLDSLGAAVDAVERARAVVTPLGWQRAAAGDSREPLRWLLRRHGPAAFDAAITSPPYATALPYADTQRLSLALLGLVGAGDLAGLDRALIGAREIGARERARLEREVRDDQAVPAAVRRLCLSMIEALEGPGVDGFRKRNMPALVLKYFRDMGRALAAVADVVRPGGGFALLVGRNRTSLGGQAFEVDTPRLLADSGPLHGWEVDSLLELDTYRRFDLHRRNSIRTETLVILRRRGGR